LEVLGNGAGLVSLRIRELVLSVLVKRMWLSLCRAWWNALFVRVCVSEKT